MRLLKQRVRDFKEGSKARKTLKRSCLNVSGHTCKKINALKTNASTSLKFNDDKRKKNTVLFGPSRLSPKFALGDSPYCECGGPDVDDEAYASLLLKGPPGVGTCGAMHGLACLKDVDLMHR